MDLTPHSDIERIVSQFVKSGRYASADDVLRSAVHLLDVRESIRPAHGRSALKRSLRGLIADIDCSLGFEEFRQARHEIWDGVSDRSAE